MRSNSSRWQAAKDAGKARKRLPASMSFCRCAHWPMDSGSSVIWLSVSVSQRSSGGSDCALTLRIWLALKPTMRKLWHWPSTLGNSVNWLSEKNRMRSLCRRGKSSGSAVRALPDKSKISRWSASW